MKTFLIRCASSPPDRRHPQLRVRTQPPSPSSSPRPDRSSTPPGTEGLQVVDRAFINFDCQSTGACAGCGRLRENEMSQDRRTLRTLAQLLPSGALGLSVSLAAADASATAVADPEASTSLRWPTACSRSDRRLSAIEQYRKDGERSWPSIASRPSPGGAMAGTAVGAGATAAGATAGTMAAGATAVGALVGTMAGGTAGTTGELCLSRQANRSSSTFRLSERRARRTAIEDAMTRKKLFTLASWSPPARCWAAWPPTHSSRRRRPPPRRQGCRAAPGRRRPGPEGSRPFRSCSSPASN